MNDFSLFNLNLDPYTVDQLRALALDFKAQAAGGQTLAMFPSHIIKGNIEGNKQNILAIDIGGSNIRAFVYDLKDGKLELRRKEKAVFKGKYYTINEFLEFVAEFISTVVMGIDKIDSIGLSFSFPANIIKNGNFIDADRTGLGTDWSKGFIVEGSEINITAELRKYLKKYHVETDKWVTINDTVGLVLSEPRSNIGLVVGTGFNIATLGSDGQIYNTEAARFSNDFIKSTLSKPAQVYLSEAREHLLRLNQKIEDNHSLAILSEIQVGGGYIYRLLIAAMCIVCDVDTDLIAAIFELEGQVFTKIASNDFVELERLWGQSFSKKRKENLKKLVKMIINRSTDIVAACLSGSAMFANIHEDIIIAADGSVIRHYPGYADDIISKIKRIMNCKNVEIEIVEQSGTTGAAYAALMDLI